MQTQTQVTESRSLFRGRASELCSESIRRIAHDGIVSRSTPCTVGITIAIALLAVSGCGGGERRVPVFKTSGSVVRADGSAVPNALVVLHATGAASSVPKPRGTTDDQGRFQLTTYEVDDGAPVGQFTVTVEQWIRDDPNLPPSNHLVATLAKPESSGLQASITQGANEIPPLTVQNK
ncbi:MAG: carboxypeptidase regulatory-like domain-containing protein [Planctomycetes bacterium]|nr:carboxypeptidase regulatory-like domain-containing protein [Planctomycetota bacterium]